jgi:hypothetical protein
MTGSFSLFEEKQLRELINLAHQHDVYVSTVCEHVNYSTSKMAKLKPEITAKASFS